MHENVNEKGRVFYYHYKYTFDPLEFWDGLRNSQCSTNYIWEPLNQTYFVMNGRVWIRQLCLEFWVHCLQVVCLGNTNISEVFAFYIVVGQS